MYCSPNCLIDTYITINDKNIHELVSDKHAGKISFEKIFRLGADAYKENFQEFIGNFNAKDHTKTVFDFDFSNPDDENYAKYRFESMLGLSQENFWPDIGNLPDAHKMRKGVEYLNHVGGVLNINRMPTFHAKSYRESLTLYKRHVSAILIFGSLINHSCDPNVDFIPVDGKVAFVVRKPIKANEQIFISYV